MPDPTLEHEAREFRQTWAERFAKFPALVPDLSWMSIWALDPVCYFLRYRDNWNEKERALIRGASAHIGEFICRCWETFAGDVRLQNGPGGVECAVSFKKGFFGTATYTLPVEASLVQILQKPQNPFPAMGKQYVMAGDESNLLGIFGYGACYGMSPFGKGAWADKMPGELKDHLDGCTPFLAQTAARHFAERYGDGPGSRPELYREQLIWPPHGYHGDFCGDTAARGITGFEKKAGAELSLEQLHHLALLPDDTASGGALLHMLARAEWETTTRDFTEHCFRRLGGSAAGYRTAALELAREKGRELDWRKTKDSTRFFLEKRLSLLPLVYLDFETCVSGEAKDLVDALVSMNFPEAEKQMPAYEGRGPQFLFQKAMLLKVRGKHAEAEPVFRQIESKHPDYRPGEFLNEHGMNLLSLKDHAGAIDRLKRAADPDEVFGRATSNLAWAFLCARQLDAALEVVERAVETSDPVVTSLLNRAAIYRELDHTEEAAEDVEWAASLAPFDRRCIANLVGPHMQ